MTTKSICRRVAVGLQILNRRWTCLIIYQLLSGPQRFSEIQPVIGISKRLLSERLKDMEEDGIVQRQLVSEPSSKVVYALTEKGIALGPVVHAIEAWSKDWVKLDRSKAEAASDGEEARETGTRDQE